MWTFTHLSVGLKAQSQYSTISSHLYIHTSSTNHPTNNIIDEHNVKLSPVLCSHVMLYYLCCSAICLSLYGSPLRWLFNPWLLFLLSLGVRLAIIIQILILLQQLNTTTNNNKTARSISQTLSVNITKYHIHLLIFIWFYSSSVDINIKPNDEWHCNHCIMYRLRGS